MAAGKRQTLVTTAIARKRNKTSRVADDVVTANSLATQLGCTRPDKISNMNSVALTHRHIGLSNAGSSALLGQKMWWPPWAMCTPRCRPSSRLLPTAPMLQRAHNSALELMLTKGPGLKDALRTEKRRRMPTRSPQWQPRPAMAPEVSATARFYYLALLALSAVPSSLPWTSMMFSSAMAASRSDQEGEGTTIAIVPGSFVCPVRATREWLKAARHQWADFPAHQQGRPSPEPPTVRPHGRRGGQSRREAGRAEGEGFQRSFVAVVVPNVCRQPWASIFKMMDVSRHKSVDIVELRPRR
jgi:hypothetical protein